jgi:hypothetical protein
MEVHYAANLRNRSTNVEASVQATREQMSEARLPMAYRDSCAHLLIPLNQCRRKEYYLPWKCEVGHERVKDRQTQWLTYAHRTRDTRTRNANMKSSRNELRRWMRSELPKMAKGVIERVLYIEFRMAYIEWRSCKYVSHDKGHLMAFRKRITSQWINRANRRSFDDCL